MERISIFILAALGIINPAVPMAKSKTTAKVHPAVSVATAKLQAKPILFFNTTGISPELDYTTGKIIKSGKSDEFTNFCVEYNKMQKEIFAKKKIRHCKNGTKCRQNGVRDKLLKKIKILHLKNMS